MPLTQELLTRIQDNHFKKQTLYLSEEEITDEDVISLVKILKHNHYIKQLELEGNFISSLGAQSLATLSNLESLNVCANFITSEGAIALAKSHLKKLNIAGNAIGDGIAAFAASPFLFELNADACPNLTNVGVEQLFLSKSIKKLSLAANQNFDKFSSACLEALASNNVLEELDFSALNMKNKYCQYIAQNKTLKRLNLSGNFIEDEGAILLAQNNSLKSLLLVHCSIKDKGAYALSKNTHLEELVLYGNQVTEIGARAFARNTTLTCLNLEFNPFNLLNVRELEKVYRKSDKKTYVRTKEDVEKLLKKSFNLDNIINSLSNNFEGL